LAAQFKFKDVDLTIFSVQIARPIILLRLLDLIIHQEVPKLFFQQELRGVVDKTTAQQSKVPSSKPTSGKNLELENFLLKFLVLIIHHEVPKLKLFSQQDLVVKTTAQQPKVPQFESTGFRNPQTVVTETSGSY
jgi:hypothetical protein